MSQDEKSKSTQSTGLSPYQTDINKTLASTYSPYIGQGTLGGMSDLEESALGMLRNADIWGPLSSAGTGLLTGTSGAEKITPEMASSTFNKTVESPTMKSWNETWKPGIKEEYAGPGYWGSARADAVTKGGRDVGDWLGSQRADWMWNAEAANRSIDEAKAGRSLSALGAVPSSLLNWTGGLFGTGAQAREILNQVTDPQVLDVLYKIMGMQTAPTVTRGVQSPGELQQGVNWANLGAQGAMLGGGMFGSGGGAALGSMSNPGSAISSYTLGGYGGGF